MQAVLDLFNVLHEPTAVYQRVAEKPRFLAPFGGLVVVMIVLAIIMRPFAQAAFQTMVAQLPPERAAQMGSGPGIVGTVVNPIIGLLVQLMLGTGLLWVLTSLSGTEARFKVLLSVLTYACATYLLVSITTTVVLFTRGVASITSFEDMFPSLGLDLAVPGASGFTRIYLSGINPFSIWGVWLTGVGISVTHKTSRGTGIAIGAIAYLLALALFAGITAFGMRMMQPPQ